MAITASAGHSGGNSIGAATNGRTAVKSIGSNIGTMFLAFAYQTAGGVVGAIAALTDAGATQVDFNCLADGTIQARRGGSVVLGATSPGAYVPGAYQHIELEVVINATVGVVNIWVNGSNVLALTSPNTKATANSTVSGF